MSSGRSLTPSLADPQTDLDKQTSCHTIIDITFFFLRHAIATFRSTDGNERTQTSYGVRLEAKDAFPTRTW